MKPGECASLADIRENIDRIDREIVAFLGKRAEYVKAAAKFKKDAKDVQAEERVRKMLAERRQWAEAEKLDPGLVESIYRLVVGYFVGKEMKEFEKGRAQKRQAVFYPRNSLSLKDDVPGVKMWGVALDNTMLTCFEVQPDSVFEKHSHESEQITFVLEGELFFNTDDGEIAVRQGEVIALPANLPHGAFTRTKAARAVDAWSPVMDKYKLK